MFDIYSHNQKSPDCHTAIIITVELFMCASERQRLVVINQVKEFHSMLIYDLWLTIREAMMLLLLKLS